MAGRNHAGRGGAYAPPPQPPQGGPQLQNVPQVGRAVERGSLLKPAAFSGKSEDALRWLNTFTKYAKAQQWDDKQSILSIATFMSDNTVAPWFDTLSEADLDCSWEEFCKQFIAQFVPPGEEARLITKISNIKWTAPETVNQYNTRFLDLVNRANTLMRVPCMDANSLLRHYLNGLPYFAHLHIGDNHADYMEAMRKATEWSRVMYVRAASGTQAEQTAAFNMMTMGIPTTAQPAALNAMPTQPTQARTATQHNGPAAGPPPTSTAPNGYGQTHPMEHGSLECYHCGEFGHLARNCGSLECYHCGEFGHLARNCPTRNCQVCFQYGHTMVNCPLVNSLRGVVQREGLNGAQQRMRFHPYARGNQTTQLGNQNQPWNQE